MKASELLLEYNHDVSILCLIPGEAKTFIQQKNGTTSKEVTLKQEVYKTIENGGQRWTEESKSK